MDDAELRLRLSACRCNGQDHDDPLLREALDALAHRPAQQEWFAEEQAFDQQMARCVQHVPVPEDLRTGILAAASLKTPVPRWRRWSWRAAAAALILGGLGFAFYQPPPQETTLAQFETEIVDMFDSMKTQGFGLDHVTGEIANVSAWLGTQGAPKPYVVKPCTKEARPFGCRTVMWRGHKVAMVCYGRGTQEAHLFVVLRDSLQNLPNEPMPKPKQVERVDGYPVASWSCRKYVYVMLGDSPETNLGEFLLADSDIK